MLGSSLALLKSKEKEEPNFDTLPMCLGFMILKEETPFLKEVTFHSQTELL
jgi:hypothetical protein